MNKYLIYYANQDSHEGQNQPFAIVNSKSRAEKIVKEILFMDTPKEFPQSGFALGAILLNKQAGDCKFSHLT